MAHPVEKYKNLRGYSSVAAWKLVDKDPANRKLYVQFKTTKEVYRYTEDDLDTDVFNKLLNTAKSGKYLGSWIASRTKPGFNGMDFLVYNAGKKVKKEFAKSLGFNV